MHVVIVEPYCTGSHEQWITGLKAALITCDPTTKVTVLALPGEHWKWRMLYSAVPLGKEFLKLHEASPVDLVLATDMLDVATFAGITGHRRIALYFHESQLSYPWHGKDRDALAGREKEYGLINIRSAMVASVCLFNSAYHLKSLKEEGVRLLRSYPKPQSGEHEATMAEIGAKSHVLPVGLNFTVFDAVQANMGALESKKKAVTPRVLWNHRWEYDKNPEEFFTVLRDLSAEGIPFELVVLGTCGAHSIPETFTRAKEDLSRHIVHWGYAATAEEYARLVWSCHVLPVTSYQEFFGVSVVEAMYCCVMPLLPKRLAYPEHIPMTRRGVFLYKDGSVGKEKDSLKQRLRRALVGGVELCVQYGEEVKNYAAPYRWELVGPQYDNYLRGLI